MSRLSIYVQEVIGPFLFFFNIFLARMDSGGEKEKKKTDRLADMKTERERDRHLSIYLTKKRRDLRLVKGKWIATDIPNQKIN